MSTDLRFAVAKGILGEITELPNVGLFVRCPGADSHTGKNCPRDCQLNLEGVPGLHCFHTSCREAVEYANHALRSAIGKVERGAGIAPPLPRKPSPEELARRERKQLLAKARDDARRWRKSIIDGVAPTPAELVASSPVPIPESPIDHWRLLLNALFTPEDVVWIGDKCDSGRSEHAARFRTVPAWLAETEARGPFTVPASFKPGAFSRSKANVANRRFLVIESDTLTKPQTLALFEWCRPFMPLRAVVDTGGKSLHGWFEFLHLTGDRFEELKIILPELGADPALFREAQPCRLPGWEREPGRFQRLLYLDQKGAR